MPSSDWRKIPARSSTSLADRFLAWEKARLNRFGLIPVRRMVVTIVVCAWPGVAYSSAASGHDIYSFDIPAQRADLALIALAEQTDRTLVFSFDETRTKNANRLVGQYDIVEALELLLAGTGLSISMGDSGQINVAEDVALNEESTMDKPKTLLGRFGAALTALFVGMGASAEDASLPEAGAIEEIVVTALRRAEGTAVMDTALAIDAMTGTELETRGFTSVMDAVSATPGVSVSRTLANGDAIQIRGVSAIIGDGVVGYYLDDLPYTRISTNESPDLNPYDLDRVEVLRGPQGTLFGAGSQGGTVRILTQDPIMNEFSGKVTGGLNHTDSSGSDHYKVQGAINIPLIEDRLALRLAASYRDEEGYIDMPLSGEDNYNDMEQTSYRAKLLWAPNDEWSLLGTYWYWEHETFHAFGDDDYEFTPAYLDLATGGAIPAPASSVFADSENELFGLTISYEGDSFSFTSSTSYFENPVQEGLPIVGFQSDADFSTQETFAQEFKFTSISDGPWNWTFGAIYLDMENQEDSVTYGFSEFFPEPLVLEQTSTNPASES